jgi:hypothetical protein
MIDTIETFTHIDLKRTAAVVLAAMLPLCAAAQEPDTARVSAWRDAIAHTDVPNAGCFRAAFPATRWSQVACVTPPAVPFLPRSGARADTVGNGNDYAAVSAGLISESTGSFPSVVGVKHESESGGVANDYSLQLNSNFFLGAACDGASSPANCVAWEQFVYSSGETSAYMQYWLINYDATCPSGWNDDGGGDCYVNSAAVTVPAVAVTQLGTMSIKAKAVKNGLDTFVTMVGTSAYATTGEDSVVDLADSWNASEFNVIGDCCGSQARFNPGASITVRIGINDGTTNAPTCEANSGTTGETNNLHLRACNAVGGAHPYVSFKESRLATP